MAERRPLVVISGVLQELPSGDTLPGGGLTNPVTDEQLTISHTGWPRLVLDNSNGAVDERKWSITNTDSTFSIQTLNDAESQFGNVITITRTGRVPDLVRVFTASQFESAVSFRNEVQIYGTSTDGNSGDYISFGASATPNAAIYYDGNDLILNPNVASGGDIKIGNSGDIFFLNNIRAWDAPVVTSNAYAITIRGGIGGSTSGDGGAAQLVGGSANAGGSGVGGKALIAAGVSYGTDQDGGIVELRPEEATGTGAAGYVLIGRQGNTGPASALHFAGDDGFAFSLKAPAAAGVAREFTLPTDAPSNGDVLTTTAAGVMSWDAPAGGSTPTYDKHLSQPGTVIVVTGTNRWYPSVNVTLVNVRASVSMAPIGANMAVRIKKNGASIGLLTINAGEYVSSLVVPSDTTLNSTDYLTVDVEQVGSSAPGEDLNVQIQFTK
jgi:hypothetical protein